MCRTNLALSFTLSRHSTGRGRRGETDGRPVSQPAQSSLLQLEQGRPTLTPIVIYDVQCGPHVTDDPRTVCATDYCNCS